MKDDENLEFPWSSTIDTGNPTSVPMYTDMKLPTVMDLTIGQKLFFKKFNQTEFISWSVLMRFSEKQI